MSHPLLKVIDGIRGSAACTERLHQPRDHMLATTLSSPQEVAPRGGRARGERTCAPIATCEPYLAACASLATHVVFPPDARPSDRACSRPEWHSPGASAGIDPATREDGILCAIVLDCLDGLGQGREAVHGGAHHVERGPPPSDRTAGSNLRLPPFPRGVVNDSHEG
jgi:hypothetical protein